MAFEFLPPEINWSTHCGDQPTFGRFSTMFDYPTKAITQASVYPKEACQPWLHYNMRLGNLAVDTSIQVGATGVFGGVVEGDTPWCRKDSMRRATSMALGPVAGLV